MGDMKQNNCPGCTEADLKRGYIDQGQMDGQTKDRMEMEKIMAEIEATEGDR